MKKMLLVLVLLFLFPVRAGAAEREVLDGAGEQARDLLEAIGIADGTVEELLEISPKKLVQAILELCRGAMDKPLQTVLAAAAFLLLTAVFRTLAPEDVRFLSLLDAICILLLVCTVFVPVAGCLATTVTAASATSFYMKILVPVLAGLLTASGNPSLALCFQTACLTIAEFISVFLDDIAVPLTAVYAALVAAGAVNPAARVEKAAELLKKGLIFVLGLAAGLFSVILSVKSVIAAAADTVTVKGAKFLVGSTVPVVGSAISDVLGTVISGLALMRSTVGILGILVIVLTVLPTLVQLLLRSLGMKLLDAVGAVLGLERAAAFFSAADGIFTILTAVLILQTFLLVIAIAMVIVITSG